MKKVIIAIASVTITASARAGDFAGAADAGHSIDSQLAAFIALVLMIAGTVVFLCKSHKAKSPVIAGWGLAVGAVTALQAGDFANAADAGYGLDRRSRLLANGIDAAGRVTLQQWLDAGAAMSRSNDGIGVMMDSLRDATRDYVSPADAGIVYKSPTSNTGSPLHGSDVDACSTGQ